MQNTKCIPFLRLKPEKSHPIPSTGGALRFSKTREYLRGCPPKNRPLKSDQNFDFLQNFSTRQGLYKVKENTFLWVLFSIIVEILRRM